MKRNHNKLAVILAGVICLAGVGTTWAHYTNVITITNPFSTKDSSAVMIENFDPDSTFLPGETVEKKPYFQNTGDTDLVLRVKVEEAWCDAEGKPLPPDAKGEPDTAKVSKGWTQSWENDWVEIGNYFYYTKILKKAGTNGDQTPEIMNSLKLESKGVSNDNHAYNYSNLMYRLDFQADAIPADAYAIRATWPLTSSATGIDKLEWKDLIQQQ